MNVVVLLIGSALCFLLTVAIVSAIWRNIEHFVFIDTKDYRECSTDAAKAAAKPDEQGQPRRWGWENGDTCVVLLNKAPTVQQAAAVQQPSSSGGGTYRIDGKDWPLCVGKEAIAAAKPDGWGRRWELENGRSCVVVDQINGVLANNPVPVPNPVPVNNPVPVPKPAILQEKAVQVPVAKGLPALPDVPMNQSGGGGGDQYIDNGTMKIGFDMNRGSGIKWVSESRSSVNLVNDHDSGRFIQQAFYGLQDGSNWNRGGAGDQGRGWVWNPVQGGSADGQGSQVDQWGIANNCFRSVVTPRHWATSDVIQSVKMEQTVCLLGGTLARCHFTMRYTGTVDNPPNDQEMPAVYVDYSLGRLKVYQGNAPWTNQPLSDITPNPQSDDVHPQSIDVSEKWAAWVNDTDYGIGIYFPHTTRINYYKFYTAGNQKDSTCHLAPIAKYPLVPGNVVEYDILIAIGNVNDMRSWFSNYRT